MGRGMPSQRTNSSFSHVCHPVEWNDEGSVHFDDIRRGMSQRGAVSVFLTHLSKYFLILPYIFEQQFCRLFLLQS